MLFSSAVLAASLFLVRGGAYRRKAHEGNDVRLVSFVEVGSWRKWKGVLGCGKGEFRVFFRVSFSLINSCKIMKIKI